jgi:hypothetical protein
MMTSASDPDDGLADTAACFTAGRSVLEPVESHNEENVLQPAVGSAKASIPRRIERFKSHPASPHRNRFARGLSDCAAIMPPSP